MYFERVSFKQTQKIAEIESFLARSALSIDTQIETFVVAYDESQVLACGGLAGHIIKCVAIAESARGSGVALQLITELTHLAFERQRTHLFIYTKPEYESLFRQCGFYLIADAKPHVVLLENSTTRLKKQCEQWAKRRIIGDKIGAIVMNANPFTLGHRYLIEQALAQSDHVHLFVVGEDASQFSYRDRFSLIQQGIDDLDRISLHQGSDYLISRATFPNYFLKDKGLTDGCYLALDLSLFRQHIAPTLGITHRFVGSEPHCAVTRAYNQNMHQLLSSVSSYPPVITVELERKCINNEPISASRVRRLLAEQNWQEIKSLVPETTFSFLQNLKDII